LIDPEVTVARTRAYEPCVQTPGGKKRASAPRCTIRTGQSGLELTPAPKTNVLSSRNTMVGGLASHLSSGSQVGPVSRISATGAANAKENGTSGKLVEVWEEEASRRRQSSPMPPWTYLGDGRAVGAGTNIRARAPFTCNYGGVEIKTRRTSARARVFIGSDYRRWLRPVGVVGGIGRITSGAGSVITENVTR